jgi:hypothetical protein
MALHARPTRRRFAGSVAAVLGAGLVGCTGYTTELGEQPPEDTPIGEDCESDNQELPDLRVRNRDSVPHTVELAVTGERQDGASETVYEETFELGPATEVENPETEVVRWVAFDPDEEDIQRYDDYRATATTDDGQTDSDSVYATVVRHPLRYSLSVEIDPDGQLYVGEMHVDVPGDWDSMC